MKYIPSALEGFMATLPGDLQCEALDVVVQEHERVKNGPWTKEEVEMKEMVKKLAINARMKVESIVAGCFNR